MDHEPRCERVSQIVPGEVIDFREREPRVKPFLMSLMGSPVFGQTRCGKTSGLPGLRAAWSTFSVSYAVTFSGTDSSRPLFVRGIRITP